MLKKKIRSETVTNVLDVTDGTIIHQTTSQTAFVEKEPDYVKLYITDIMKLSNLPKSCNSLLMELLKRTTYENQIVIVKSIREEICSKLGMADITFRKAMDQFIEKGILSKKDKNVFVANPFLFARGSWDSIKKVRLLVEYNSQGRFLLRENIEQSELPFPNVERPSISGVKFGNKIESQGTQIFYCG